MQEKLDERSATEWIVVPCFGGAGLEPEVTGQRAEKSFCMLKQCYPYRKPTQVDGLRILRRTGEPLLRN